MLHQFYTWQLYDTPHQFVHQTLHPALTNTNLDRTMVGVGEEVNIGFKPPVDSECAAMVLPGRRLADKCVLGWRWRGQMDGAQQRDFHVRGGDGARCAALLVCDFHGAGTKGV